MALAPRLQKRLAIDAGIVILTVLAMSFSIAGDFAHEVISLLLAVLALLHVTWVRREDLHHAGRAGRILHWLLGAAFVLATVSGVFVSTYLFKFLPVTSIVETMRTTHLVASMWFFVLAGVHLGLHSGLFAYLVKSAGKGAYRVYQAAVLAAALWGAWVFVKRGIFEILTNQVAFAFFDDSEPILLFSLDYVAMALTFAFATSMAAAAFKKFSA